jgi:hypothetical protein
MLAFDKLNRKADKAEPRFPDDKGCSIQCVMTGPYDMNPWCAYEPKRLKVCLQTSDINLLINDLKLILTKE